jgi:hypothetical protein
MKDSLQNPQALLNLFYPGSFPDPLRLPSEEESVPEKSPTPPEPKPLPETLDLAAMEKRIIAAVTGRKSEKRKVEQPFIRRKEAIGLLGSRSTLEKCERAGWITASTRQHRLVLYPRDQVMAAFLRLRGGEYP